MRGSREGQNSSQRKGFSLSGQAVCEQPFLFSFTYSEIEMPINLCSDDK